MKHDYLIVGQGLAGSILAYRLWKRGKKVIVIDERKQTSCSIVAAGLVNPFTGPKMVKSWRAELLFPVLKQFYSELEIVTKTKFLNEHTIYRPFASVKEQNDWDGRSTQDNYQVFIKSIREKDVHSKYVNDPFGGVEIEGYVLNVAKFIDTLFAFLTDKVMMIQDYFDENDLVISGEGIDYGDIHVKNIIFCSGHQICQSRYFDWLPMAPVKGEILHIKTECDFETIYNQSCFIIPRDTGICKAGSTYNRKDLTDNPTESGKDEITKKVNALLKMNYEIVKQEAGIRPGTVTRRPLIGTHPAHNNMFVFNGLGTKGVSLAPFFSDQFVKYLEDDNNLDAEVDIKKYYSLYFKSHFSVKN